MSHMKHLKKFNEVKLIAQATYQRDEYTYEKGKQQALEVAKEMEDQFLVDLKDADYPISVEVRDDSKRFIGPFTNTSTFLRPGGIQDFWRIFVTITDSTRPNHKIVKWGDVKDDITHLINYYKGDFEVTNIYARKLKDGGRVGRAYASVGSGGEAYNWDNFCKNTKDEEEFIFFQIRFAERI